MVCPTCKGVTKDGKPCKHKTCKFAPKCFHHTQVRVAPSSIAGKGLFAKEPIRKGSVVADYTVGTERLTRNQFQAKYPSGKATHVWKGPGDTYYDAEDDAKSVSGMANRAPAGKRNNARITGGGKVKTTRPIKAGEEITVSYGQGYRI